MLNEGGDAEMAMTVRISRAWNKFRELSPLLSSKSVPAKIKGRLYKACVRSCMLYGSEIWAVTTDMNNKLESTEMRMIRKMCNVQMRDLLKNEELRNSGCGEHNRNGQKKQVKVVWTCGEEK